MILDNLDAAIAAAMARVLRVIDRTAHFAARSRAQRNRRARERLARRDAK